ncbi:MAG: hypothetical protein H6719_33250 [Sandaracinaceae bacterium]|nr:hypothetical protein [Sandaracinaceae bacterium]
MDEPGSAVRIARRLAGAPASPREVSAGAAVALAADGAWFERDGRRVSLARRHAMRRLLHALVVHLRNAPGSAMSTDGLVAAGWPGERMRPDSGAARVYSAVRALRRMGLEGVLISAHGGYLLSATASIAVA